MKVVIDDVAIYAIECCLINSISTLFTPSSILQMDQELVSNIAAESQHSQALREQVERKIEVLQVGLDVCKVHANRKPLGEVPSTTVIHIRRAHSKA